ncbi:MAG: aspartate dehydrogenase [Defluviicoccus sp.]|nr:aspartate dehydrogenase [Defluviicoccus sp.]
MRLALIGYGAIGRSIVARLRELGEIDRLDGILVRSRPGDDPGVPVWYDAEEMIAAGPDIVIEAAGHEALRAIGPAAVASGADLIVAAVGALADEDFAAELRAAARHGARVIVPPGAVAGLDGLVAARSAGLEAVTYSSYKPPHAWRGTRAEAVIDLDHEEEEIVFFTGSAREAALHYPQNANVGAAVSIAGLGLDETRVRLISSRKVDDPLGVIEASGGFGSFRFECLARASPSNPKTSAITADSLLACARLGIGIPAFGATPPGRSR